MPKLPNLLVACAVALAATGPSRASAQVAAHACAYDACSLRIDPQWNGLALVRPSGAIVANLNFFLPRDIVPTLAAAGGADAEALADARTAVQVRRAAAVLTDVGLLLAACVGTRSVSAGRLRRPDVPLAILGGAALGISVPLQFSADAALSRAAWRFNAQFAR